jgi:hypothetical protein
MDNSMAPSVFVKPPDDDLCRSKHVAGCKQKQFNVESQKEQ